MLCNLLDKWYNNTTKGLSSVKPGITLLDALYFVELNMIVLTRLTRFI